jgi:hypothetical protein
MMTVWTLLTASCCWIANFLLRWKMTISSPKMMMVLHLHRPALRSLCSQAKAFSDIYSGVEWDLKKLDPTPTSSTTTAASNFVAAAEENQDYIPKLLEKADWDANLRMEDVLATAKELAKAQTATLLPPAPPAAKQTPPPPALAPAPGSSSYTDAFKSREWSIMPDTIADIDYTPDMLDLALSLDGTEIQPSETNLPTKNRPEKNIFTSLDWVLKEILGGGENKNTTCYPPDDIPSFSLPSSALFDIAADGPHPKKTNWDAMFIEQLPMLPASFAAAVSPSPPGVADAAIAATISAAVAASAPDDIAKPVMTSPPKKKRIRKKRKKVVPNHKVYVSKISEVDVLLGRGGRSNHHPGNKRYREEVENYRKMYDTLSTADEKTQISQALVDAINIAGGRFLEKEDRVADKIGEWYIVPNIVARRKASQALREDNDPDKRKAKRARYLEKKKKKAVASD